jgi:hypothetical protein
MDEADQRTLKSLKRLGSIIEGQRISTEGKDGDIVVEQEGAFQFFFRFFRGESRAGNIIAVEKKFISAYGIVERTINREQHFQISEKQNTQTFSLTQNMERMSNMQLLSRTCKLIREALIGFKNLISTYKTEHDQNIESDINDVIDRIREKLNVIEEATRTMMNSLTPEWKKVFDAVLTDPDSSPWNSLSSSSSKPIKIRKRSFATAERSNSHSENEFFSLEK